jgi:acyl carrier protein phosphodiesterase
MKTDNWLYNYSKREGIEKSLKGLIRRSKFITDHKTAYRLFNENYYDLQHCYSELFKDVKEFAKHEMEQLVS